MELHPETVQLGPFDYQNELSEGAVCVGRSGRGCRLVARVGWSTRGGDRRGSRVRRVNERSAACDAGVSACKR